ncbi:fibrillin-2-like [Penaeus chinensis]|uniref:fibrillin-2-like n=1 Tax=Penaeus chinensis TaxID=139456 RepID=UPI001FB83978|nr:fibrillin-2-like [Penaeus chinensis]
MDGYDIVDGECQDADECKGGPCKEKEACINTPGSYKCVCQSGYMRNHDGVCINVNECGSPSLHDCEHVCEDAEPPLRFSCSCYPGFTWQAFTRSCVIDDDLTKCECEDKEMSVCYKPRDGEKQCHPRPGYVFVNGTFLDEAECESEESVNSWCGVSSECVDGEGTATCECLAGYANDTINYGQCEAIVCPTGTILSDSSCLGAIFGVDNTEILSVTPAAKLRSATTRSDSTTTSRVDFLLMAPRPNMTGEVNVAIRGQCMNPGDPLSPLPPRGAVWMGIHGKG